MIISKEVKVRWNNATREHYISKGYILTKYEELLTVKVEDLFPGSSVKVDVLCIYCKNTFARPYSNVLNSIDKSFSKKYSCKSCAPLKQVEELSEKQKRGLLDRENNGYWNFKENRIKELNNFIAKYGNIDNMQKIDSGLYRSILKNDKSLYNILSDMNIKWETVSSLAPVGYYRNFNNLKLRLEEYILQFNKFPSISEVYSELGINMRDIGYHGGMESVKEKMGYVDENDLVDDNGFRNNSRLEFIVAQYLIANNIHYKREKFPFEESMHRCDFLLEEDSGDVHYVEVWGYGKEDTSQQGVKYNISRNEKELLYKNAELNLISIEYEHLERKNSTYIQEYLKRKFAVIEELSLLVFDDSDYLHPKSLSNEMILNEIMKCSTEKDVLPTTLLLREVGMQFYYNEILKRFDGYGEFAEFFNKKLTKELWTEEKVLDVLDDIVSKGKPINKQTMKMQGLLKATSFIFKTFGTTRALPLKLKYYNEYWDRNKPISKEDIVEIEKVAKCEMNDKRITREEIELSNEVLKLLRDVKVNIA